MAKSQTDQPTREAEVSAVVEAPTEAEPIKVTEGEYSFPELGVVVQGASSIAEAEKLARKQVAAQAEKE